jgi:hypothetical protein
VKVEAEKETWMRVKRRLVRRLQQADEDWRMLQRSVVER